MKHILILILSLLPWSAHAGRMSKIIGNGGDVLVCENREPKVQLLDFAETRILRNKSIQLIDPVGLTYKQKLEWIRQRIVDRFPELGSQLSGEIAYFENTNVKLDDLELEDIQDSFHKFHLSGCSVHQIANQSAPLVDDDPSFIIANELWTQLSETDKAGLVLHEVLYRMGLRYSLEHSIGIRYLVSLFFDDNLQTISDRQWIQALQYSRIKFYEMNNIRFPVFSGNVDSCRIPPGALSCEDPVEIQPAVVTYDNSHSIRTLMYPEGPETLIFKMKDGFTSQIDSSRFDFEFGMEGFRMRTSGVLTVFSRFDRTGLGKAVAKVNGEFNIYKETYCGPLSFVDFAGKEFGKSNYCGTLGGLTDVYVSALKTQRTSGN